LTAVFSPEKLKLIPGIFETWAMGNDRGFDELSILAAVCSMALPAG
jgi:hypothetical protein